MAPGFFLSRAGRLAPGDRAAQVVILLSDARILDSQASCLKMQPVRDQHVGREDPENPNSYDQPDQHRQFPR
jgi:hypothetical protein